MVTLPDAEWRQRAGLDRLVAVLGGAEGESRFVGGAVRDALLGIAVADVDIATRLQPTEVVECLSDAGIKAVPTGLAHGTVTAVIDSGPVEVTTLRRDVSTDGRHAVVAFTNDWREDAARRDFTINALFADPSTGEIFDYFGGLADLEARRVRFIGDARQRIAEDHLRILRFFRFLARFGDVPDTEGLAACAERANDLMALSRERIRDELLKLLVAQHAVRTLQLMLDNAILLPVLPEIVSTDRLEQLARREAAAGLAADPVRRLAALISPDKAEAVGARLKLSNVARKRLATATQPPFTDDPRVLQYCVGDIGAEDQTLLADVPDEEVAARLGAMASWQVPDFPLTGGALVARGLSKGPVVARTLALVRERWIAEGFPGSARVDELADEMVQAALGSASSEKA